ncbi:MAG: aminotransferase class V-fold PLP-dependent enzyme [bacterium]
MTRNKFVYLNNAATSWPKPEQVIEKVLWALRELSSTPGRAGYSALQGEREIFETREEVARLIGAQDSSRIIFTSNATQALNLAITGFLREACHVITTSMDHNSIVRPLARAEDEIGVEVTRVQADEKGMVGVGAVTEAITPRTRLIVLTHASNVVGSIQPVEEICGALGTSDGVRPVVLVDAAQTIGVLPLNVAKTGIDLLAVPGHKSLYGLQGTGFLYIAPGVDLVPIIEGGTGGQSTLVRQPEVLPEKFEAGTPNTPGIAALGEAIRFIHSRGIDNIRNHEQKLIEILIEGLSKIQGVVLYGPASPDERVAVLSFNVKDLDPAEVESFLEQTRSIQLRVGLHCSPMSHRTIGTFPEGTVRVSPGIFSTEEDVLSLVEGVRELQKFRRKD